MATKDYFLKLDGIEGESQADKHKGEIDVESFSWGENNPAVYGSHGDKRKVTMQEVHFTMFASKASTKLMAACAIGKEPIKKATLTIRKAGGDQQEFMIFTFSEVFITSYSISGPANETSRPEKVGHEKNENPIPLEQISLSFKTIEVEYKGQKASGDTGGKNIFRFNLPQMKST